MAHRLRTTALWAAHISISVSGHTQVCGQTLPGLLKCAVVKWNYMHVPECTASSHSSAHRVLCFLRLPHTHPQHTQDECHGLLLRLLSLGRALSEL